MIGPVISDAELASIDKPELLAIVQALRDELAFKQKVIDKITHEMAVLKRLKFAAKSEHFTPEQRSLLEETIDTDLAAAQAELDKARAAAKAAARPDKEAPKRQPLPPELPRTEHRHDPENTTCRCGCALKRIGEDVSEKLDYAPGVFAVERHVRGKWVCASCETLVQAPVAVHVIDKGIPTCGLLAHVMIAKFIDHLPLYRQEKIFGRAGLAIPQSTLADWVGTCGVQLQALVDALREELLTHRILHADETPVAMLKPGKGKTHRAYIWSYCTTSFDPVKAVSSTSPRAAPESTPVTSWASTPRSRTVAGTARSSATTTRATRPPSRTGSSRPAASLTRDASSTTSGPRTEARLPRRP